MEINETELDKYPSFISVLYVLCADMYDSRSLYVDKTNLNKLVESILGLHDRNFLWLILEIIEVKLRFTN